MSYPQAESVPPEVSLYPRGVKGQFSKKGTLRDTHFSEVSLPEPPLLYWEKSPSGTLRDTFYTPTGVGKQTLVKHWEKSGYALQGNLSREKVSLDVPHAEVIHRGRP